MHCSENTPSFSAIMAYSVSSSCSSSSTSESTSFCSELLLLLFSSGDPDRCFGVMSQPVGWLARACSLWMYLRLQESHIKPSGFDVCLTHDNPWWHWSNHLVCDIFHIILFLSSCPHIAILQMTTRGRFQKRAIEWRHSNWLVDSTVIASLYILCCHQSEAEIVQLTLTWNLTQSFQNCRKSFYKSLKCNNW